MRSLTTLVLLLPALPALAAPQLTLVNDNIIPGTSVSVQLSGGEHLGSRAWIGVIPSFVEHGSTRINDNYDISYQYTSGKASGTFAFTAPGKPGQYDLRLSDDVEKASVTFTVKEPAASDIKFSADTESTYADRKFKATLSSPYVFGNRAWVGIFPADKPSTNAYEADRHDLSYHYVPQKKSNTFDFRAPQKAGEYELRFYTSTDRYGIALASLPLSVKLADSSQVSMSIPREKWAGNAEIPVAFKANPDFSDRAWIGVVPSNVAHGSADENDRYDTSYEYLSRRAQGTALLRTPNKEGLYDLRMHDSNNGREIAHISFEVTHLLDAEYLKKEIDAQGKVVLQGIYFDTNKATLKAESKAVLDSVAKLMKEQSSLFLRIEGHTDNEGDDAHNQTLSEQRAQSVKAALISRGIADNRLGTKGYGESQPVADNSTATGRSLNRRVELSRI